MERLHVALTNCHGIRKLDTAFDFSNDNQAVAIYAPNGTMKTSFAQTFKDFAGRKESSDRIFPDRESERSITDERGDEIEADDVVVVLSYDEEMGPSESTSTLLVNQELRREYQGIQVELVRAREDLVAALRKQSRTKQDVATTVSRVFTGVDDRFYEALAEVQDDVDQFEGSAFADLPYDDLFNEKVKAALRSPGVQSELANYVSRLNELLDESVFFSRSAFNFYNAANVTKTLGDNGFFTAKHSLVLHGQDSTRQVHSDEDLKALIAGEKNRITDDTRLREKLGAVEKALNKNIDTRRFFRLISEQEDLLPELANMDEFSRKIWKSYFKSCEEAYGRVVKSFKDTTKRCREIEKRAAEERTQWETVIQIFNDRFHVPFRLSAENKHRVALGQEAMLKLIFEFQEGEEVQSVERDDLLSILSNGEKKALYILNVLFEVEARKSSGRETLFVIDDLADSFDYKNKYAIIQYLKEMAEHPNFRLIILSHNFDFFRTVINRGVISYRHCFMAQKDKSKVLLNHAQHIKNPFILGFKKKFFMDGMQRIASIPFMRNILEYTKGGADPDYLTLTSLLHWKENSESISNANLDRIFKDIFAGHEEKVWKSRDAPVFDLILEQAEIALDAPEGVNFEHKIVLSIAMRMLAERYMIEELENPQLTSKITSNQTYKLFQAYEGSGLGQPAVLETLDAVVLMTPESVHLNSFMYEPILDMSDAALRDLYSRVKSVTLP